MNLFANSELLYEGNKSNLSVSQIRGTLTNDFVGIDHFLNFYQMYDGVRFLRGAMMFRSKFYEVAKGDWDKIEVGFFLTLSNIVEIQEVKEHDNQELYTLCRTHVPFADDGFGNIIWVEVPSGTIKVYYHEYDLEEGVKVVAPNFADFCSSLENFSM